jgi:xylulokinase
VASFTITKLAWLAQHEPEVCARVRHVLLPHDWLTFRLTGAMTTDRGDASGTGYWSPTAGAWASELLTMVDPSDPDRDWQACLPRVLAADDAAGPLLPEAADAFGLANDATAPIVAAGTGDNMAAALGVALRPGDTAVSLGTSGTVFAVSDGFVGDPTGAVAGFADASGRFLPLVCTLNATLVTETIAALVGADIAELDALAAAEPAGAGGMVLVPYLAGERTPNRPLASGAVAGLRTDARRAQLARAAFEGVVCGLLDGLDALDAATAATAATGEGRLVLVGGGSRSATYRQTLADLAGRVVTVPHARELVALGACVQAAAAVEGGDPLAVAQRWRLSEGEHVEHVEPAPVDREGILARYRAVAAALPDLPPPA